MFLKKLYLIILFFFAFSKGVLAVENKILFKINNKIITTIDIYNEINYLNLINKSFKELDNKSAFKIASESLIRQKIKEIELLKNFKSLQIDEGLLENILSQYYFKLNLKSKEDFVKLINDFDLTLDYFESKINQELLWDQLIYIKFSEKLKIDEDAIKKNILQNKNNYEYLFSEIIFEVKEKENLDKKFNEIKNLIKNEGFERAVLTYSVSNTASNGGKLNWIKDSSLNKEILKKIKDIDTGDHTEPLVIPGGFLILKINEKKQYNRTSEIDQEIEEISQKMRKDLLIKYSLVYYNKIKKNIIINEF